MSKKKTTKSKPTTKHQPSVQGKRLDRRTLLRGMIGGSAVAIGLPLLDIFCNDHGTAFAQGEAFPRRFGLFYWGNGNIPWRWNPEATDVGPDYALSEQLEPLAPVKSDVAVVTGTVAQSTAREPHHDGAASFLAGTPILTTGQQEMLAPTIDTLTTSLMPSTVPVIPFSRIRTKAVPGVDVCALHWSSTTSRQSAVGTNSCPMDPPAETG